MFVLAFDWMVTIGVLQRRFPDTLSYDENKETNKSGRFSLQTEQHSELPLQEEVGGWFSKVYQSVYIL